MTALTIDTLVNIPLRMFDYEKIRDPLFLNDEPPPVSDESNDDESSSCNNIKKTKGPEFKSLSFFLTL